MRKFNTKKIEDLKNGKHALFFQNSVDSLADLQDVLDEAFPDDETRVIQVTLIFHGKCCMIVSDELDTAGHWDLTDVAEGAETYDVYRLYEFFDTEVQEHYLIAVQEAIMKAYRNAPHAANTYAMYRRVAIEGAKRGVSFSPGLSDVEKQKTIDGMFYKDREGGPVELFKKLVRERDKLSAKSLQDKYYERPLNSTLVVSIDNNGDVTSSPCPESVGFKGLPVNVDLRNEGSYPESIEQEYTPEELEAMSKAGKAGAMAGETLRHNFDKAMANFAKNYPGGQTVQSRINEVLHDGEQSINMTLEESETLNNMSKKDIQDVIETIGKFKATEEEAERISKVMAEEHPRNPLENEYTTLVPTFTFTPVVGERYRFWNHSDDDKIPAIFAFTDSRGIHWAIVEGDDLYFEKLDSTVITPFKNMSPIPKEKCSTKVVKTGEHCPNKPTKELYGDLLCDECYQLWVRFKADQISLRNGVEKDDLQFGEIVRLKCTAIGRYMCNGKGVFISAMDNDRCIDDVVGRCSNKHNLPVVTDEELQAFKLKQEAEAKAREEGEKNA